MNLPVLATKLGLQVKKYSPEILMVTGVVTFIGTVVVACKQTTKASEILDAHKNSMDEIKEAADLAEEDNLVGEDGELIEYTPEDVKKDKLNVWAHTAVGFTKLYLPAIALGAVSLTSFLAANKILKGRYLAMVGAFNAVSDTFEKYRERVKVEYGNDMDRHFMYGAERSKVDVIETDENGKKHKTKEEIENVIIENNHSPYARFFDQSCADWDKSPELNRMFLEAVQDGAQKKLERRGHLFLNEVYDMLGFERTSAGALVGWVLGNGDDYIDFGLYDQESKATRRFVNGLENVILLDFNVDGVIYDKI